ncbi:hypothetical protein QUF58_09370 [Anaerolineales bacterium HSG24]|nr:hypothetical protein [Anaerolineales bacterium HSG24]
MYDIEAPQIDGEFSFTPDTVDELIETVREFESVVSATCRLG